MTALRRNSLVDFIERNKRVRLHAASPAVKAVLPTDGLLGTPSSPPDGGQWGYHLPRFAEAACLGDGGHAYVAIIDRGLQIVGDPGGPTVIRMTTDDPVVEIGFSRVTFSNVEITGGRQVRDSGATVRGGCVRMIGSDVSFVDSAITDCYCIYEGGGIAVQYSTVTFLRTTISGSVSETAGGGIFQAGFVGRGTTITMVNSTLSGNQARFQGGGLFHRGGGGVLISNSTIADNEAPFGDAILNEHQPVYVQNSIIEGKCRGIFPNTRGGNVGGPDIVDHCFKFSILATDHAAADLGLLPLGNYGGPTKTHGLLPGSPALDAGDPAYCEPTDQRGAARPVGAACDAGAIEGIVNPLDVPALGGWGLAVLTLLVGGAALVVLRRIELRGPG